MRLAVLVIALGLAGCDAGPASRGDLKQERQERLDVEDALRGEIRSLADRVDRLEREKRVASTHQPPQRAVSAPAPDRTAELALRAQLKQMTADGVCGQEPPTRLDNGGVILRNRECTKADLR